MFCCRRRQAPPKNFPSNHVRANTTGLDEIDVDVAAWFDATRPDPCPICMETPEFGEEVSYETVSTHSWHNNDRCDGHGMCRPCLQRYVEIKLLDDGIANIRCPGECCRYQLLPQDIDQALATSQHKDHARQAYEKIRNEHGGLRLQSVLKSALTNENESWIWSACQACPRCLVLARRETGCDHLVCRCGCDFCFICGGEYGYGPTAGTLCCCGKFHFHKGGGRAFLAAALSLKHDVHPSERGLIANIVRREIKRQLNSLDAVDVVDKWQQIVCEKLDIDLRCARIRATRMGAVLCKEKADDEWARQQVVGTMKALQVRKACESFGVLLQHAGSGITTTFELLQHVEERNFDGFLVNDIYSARAEQYGTEWCEDVDAGCESEYEDDLNTDSKSHRRAAHGARRRVWIETAWTSGAKGNKAKAPDGSSSSRKKQRWRGVDIKRQRRSLYAH